LYLSSIPFNLVWSDMTVTLIGKQIEQIVNIYKYIPKTHH
jgi:hypothetical protein